MSELVLGQFEGSIHDVTRWCAERWLLSTTLDSPEVQHRRALLEQANRLWEQAKEAAKKGWRKRNIQDTKEWKLAQRLLSEVVESSLPSVGVLRSLELKPHLPTDISDSDWIAAVDEVVLKRSAMVKLEWTAEIAKFEKGGRLLLYFPHENLACGAAQVSSGGFFDADNCPPWDLWVGFSQETLVSWVPPVLIEVAQMGIDVNPEGCIGWAEE